MSFVEVFGLVARTADDALCGASFSLSPGISALVGGAGDGARAALATLAGVARVQRGEVLIAGATLTDPGVRRATAYVPREPAWPDALRTDEALRMASRLRAPPRGPTWSRDDAAQQLARFGLEALAPRRGATLEPDERRAVALVEAVGSEHVRLLLVEEPRVGIDARATRGLEEALRNRARSGVCVAFATASPRDAGDLADGYVLFTRGVARPVATPTLRAPGAGAYVRVVASDVRALLAVLATSPNVTSLAFRGSSLRVGAEDEATAAAAVAHAATASGVVIGELRVEQRRPRGTAAGLGSAS